MVDREVPGPPGWERVEARLRQLLGQIAEPAVTLTDWALTAECACCMIVLARQPRDNDPLRRAGIAFFGATGVAALLGGVVHGFFPGPKPHPWRQPLWAATLLALGASGAAAWTIAARVALWPGQSRPVLLLGALGYLTYGGIILSGRQTFAVAIAGYLPANLFLLGAFGARFARRGERAAGAALAGIILTLLASGVQQFRLGLHPRYCDHNTLYHLLMGIALPLFCGGVRRLGGTLARERGVWERGWVGSVPGQRPQRRSPSRAALAGRSSMTFMRASTPPASPASSARTRSMVYARRSPRHGVIG